MPIEHTESLSRDVIRAHQEKLFLFADNRERYGGSVREIRDEPNTHGIRIKNNPRNNETSFYTDADYARSVRMIAEDLVFPAQWLALGRVVVIPDALLTGQARLAEKAPLIAEYLMQRLADLALSRTGVE